MVIRRATREDLGPVAALIEAAGLPPLPHSPTLANLLVALGEDAVVGTIYLEVVGLRGLVRSAVVAPSHARRGIGTSLMQSLVARAHELSLRELYLLTENGKAFFARAGFEPVPREVVPSEIRSTREYREQCLESATVMRLKLATRFV